MIFGAAPCVVFWGFNPLWTLNLELCRSWFSVAVPLQARCREFESLHLHHKKACQ
jgi:hypothetical protein